MIPKVAAALARVLEPIEAVARPGESVSSAHKSEEGGEGGHGALSYSGDQNPKEEEKEEPPGKSKSPLPLQPGLTQVILDLNGKRQELVAGTLGVAQYESGARNQKKPARLRKGSMLDKKAG